MRERNLSERKELVGEVRAECDNSVNLPGGGDAVREKEEIIWGRGVNGGVRRRVRERWDRKENGAPQ